ncbi:hypothetical protein BIW11_08117 [Tropilaelaps mercedesae]|uniref:Uncharacterized protein n=1 Tax=Tropilaelaps mercedesae TaxID=418985 RepID=A0A1V9XQZ2_9ACAR|nr:hypothetical protein BIW11_08117 [Tropilaelaps mercedesae]
MRWPLAVIVVAVSARIAFAGEEYSKCVEDLFDDAVMEMSNVLPEAADCFYRFMEALDMKLIPKTTNIEEPKSRREAFLLGYFEVENSLLQCPKSINKLIFHWKVTKILHPVLNQVDEKCTSLP